MPTELTERQKSIFDAVIREYIARAEPVASAELVERRRLPYSAATVRNELLALDEAGFLAQPHTSAGRVPTDKGYRYFISRLTRGNGVAGREKRALGELRGESNPAEFIKQASRLLAEFTHNVALAGFPGEDIFYKSGMGGVMREPEFSDLDLMHEFSALMDEIENEILRRFDTWEIDEPRTFIGSENPIRQARHYGMIISSYETPFNKESIIALVGPKRMDYEHNLALLRHLGKIMAS